MEKFPLVSVIIVNWNGGDVFRECFDSLTKIDYPNWELIVVDNGSTDNSKLLLKGKKLILIQNKKNLGFAKANNQGYKASSGKYILLLNNDTKVTSDFLGKLVDRMEDNEAIGVIQPKIYMMDKEGFLDNSGSFLTRIGFLTHWGFGEKDGPNFQKERLIFSAKGACMLIRKKVIDKVDLFDEDFISYFEESDFCWRVWLGGWEVLYYPEAEVYHKVGFTIRRLDVGSINYHYSKNRITSLIKNLSLNNLLVILPMHLLISQGITIVFFLKGNFKNFLMIEKAIFWNVFHLKKTLEKRNKVQKMRVLRDKELFNEKKLMHPVNWGKFYGDFKRVEEDIKRRKL